MRQGTTPTIQITVNYIDLSGYVKSSELTAISTSDLNTMWG